MYVENAICFSCFYKPIADDPHERRHAEVYNNLKDLPYPFNFEIPAEAPQFGRDNISTSTVIKHKEIKTLVLSSKYYYRYNGNIEPDLKLGSYDRLDIKFNHKKLEIDYKQVVYELFPLVIKGYGGYKAELLFRNVWIDYRNQFKAIIDKLYAHEVDVDGTDNIFTLFPAQFWSEELCQKALGYSAREAIKRLQKAGALMVEPLLDGVYSVLNDNRQIELEEYTQMNHKFKRALGINDGTYPRAKLFGIF